MKEKTIFLMICLIFGDFSLARPVATVNLWNPTLPITQKEGTNLLLKEYLSEISTSSDTLYAILFSPSYCPRCEAVIRPFIEDLKRLFPKEETLLITAYPDPAAAKRYLKQNQYKADHYIWDTFHTYSRIFSFNSDGATGLYILKLDRKNGRMITGGEPFTYNENFVRTLHNQIVPIPYHTYKQEILRDKKNFSSSSSHFLQYTTCFCQTDSLHPVSGVYGMPLLKENKFIYTDELGNSAYCFEIDPDKQTASFIKAIVADSDEKDRYINLPSGLLQSEKKDGQVFYIPLSPNFMGKGKIGLSYSLPRIFMESPRRMAYYNQPAIIVRDAKTLEKLPLISFDTILFHDSYMYLHFTFFPLDSTHIIMGCQKDTWPMEWEPEDYKGNSKIDPFMDEFYTKQQNPYLAIFDLKTGKPVMRFGNLEMPQRLSRTGYYYLEPIADVYKDEIVYGNGYTGNLYLADKKTPEKFKQKITLFQIDTEHFPQMDSTHFYKLEHVKPYNPFFNRKITTVALTDTKVHCLVSTLPASDSPIEKAVYEYVAVERKMGGKITRYPIIPENTQERVLAYGLARIGKEVIPYYFAKKGEEAFIKFVTPIIE